MIKKEIFMLKTMHVSLIFEFLLISSFTSKAAISSMPLCVIKKPFIMAFDWRVFIKMFIIREIVQY